MESEYVKAHFEDEEPIFFQADDFISGNLENDIQINMTDLAIKVQDNKNNVQVFLGMFVYFRCNKNIGTYIEILKNKSTGTKQGDRMQMDSGEFEKYFNVFSNNKIIAMQLLTSDVMTDLIDFYNKYKINFEIVIREDTVYMRFFTGNMFEPKISKNPIDKSVLFVYYSILKFIIEISNKIYKTIQETEV